MLPAFFLSALMHVQSTVKLPIALPPALCIKKDTFANLGYEEETFEIKPEGTRPPLRVKIEGQMWQFQLTATSGRMGITALSDLFRQSLVDSGWAWQWEERGIAKREAEGQECWIRFGPGGSSELKVTLMERGEPLAIPLKAPGPTPEAPNPGGDFPYLSPWPEAKFSNSRVLQMPIMTDIKGQTKFLKLNCLEKEYLLKAPVKSNEFVATYTKALERAGWEIEGNLKGDRSQIQAIYAKNGRDIRATLTLAGPRMFITVTDVGAQRGSEPTANMKRPASPR